MDLIMDKIVNIDMDNTICNWAWPDIGTLKEGAKESLQKFK